MPVLMIAGLVSLVLGIVLFFAWFGYILALIKAILPLAFIISGAVASYLGWEEMRESRTPTMDFSSPDEADRYKSEAKAYQAKLNEIKNGSNEVIEVAASSAESARVEETGSPEPPTLDSEAVKKNESLENK